MNLSRASAAVAGVLILIVGLCLGWVGAHFAALRSNAATVAVFNGWRVTCTAAMAKIRACGLARDVVDAKSGQHVATLSLVPGAKGQVLVVTVPYNVLIPQGLGLSFGGGKAKVYPYFTCNGVGCVARIALDDAMRASLRQEQQGQLVFVNANSQSVQVTYPLAGFKRADDTARGFEGSGMRYLLFSAMAGPAFCLPLLLRKRPNPKRRRRPKRSNSRIGVYGA